MKSLKKFSLLFVLLINLNIVFSKGESNNMMLSYIEGHLTNYVTNLEKNTKFLNKDSDNVKYLNITDFTVNAILNIAHKSFADTLDITLDEKEKPKDFPININSASLSMLVEEFGRMSNTQMSLRLFVNKEKTPEISIKVDGFRLFVSIGMEFGMFYQKDIATSVLHTEMDLLVKIHLTSKNNKLNIDISKIYVEECFISFNPMSVNQDKLKINAEKFFNLIAANIRGDMDNIDVPALLNNVLKEKLQMEKHNFTDFDLFINDGSFHFTLK